MACRRFVRRWKPDYVFVENVPGLQRVDGLAGPLPEFMTLLKKLGYSFDLKVVPALSFGVPQKRERLILMAAKTGELRIPAYEDPDRQTGYGADDDRSRDRG